MNKKVFFIIEKPVWRAMPTLRQLNNEKQGGVGERLCLPELSIFIIQYLIYFRLVRVR